MNSSYLLEKIIDKNDDPVKFKLIQKFITTRDTASIKILCQFDKIVHAIHFDLKQDDSKRFVVGEMPIILRKDKPLNINHITVEQHIANKLYVILKNATLDNTQNKKMRRFKDFYDLFSLIDLTPTYSIDLVKEYFLENTRKYGEIDMSKVDLRYIDEKFIKTNQKSFDEDRIKYAFLRDMTFEELSNTARVILEDTLKFKKS